MGGKLKAEISVGKDSITKSEVGELTKGRTVNLKAVKSQIDFIEGHSLRDVIRKVNLYNLHHENNKILKEDVVQMIKEEDTYVLLYYKYPTL